MEPCWSAHRQHRLPLTQKGEQEADAVRDELTDVTPGLVLCSPMRRALDTARRAGLLPDDTVDDLREWDYGAWEGRTTAEIRVELGDPTWLVWDHPVPAGRTPGEQLDQVGERVDRVIGRCAPVLEDGHDVVLVAHGHVLRILTARWLGLAPVAGRLFALDPARISALGFEHEQHVIRSWNATAAHP